MIFHPQNEIKKEGRLLLSGSVHALAHPCLNKAIIKEFFYNFSFESASLTIEECPDYSFTVGNAEALPLNGYSYTIHVTESGLCVYAENEKDLLLGFMTLLDRLHATQLNDAPCVAVDAGEIRERALIPMRMVHLCVFPETELWEVRRFLRFCAALKYTHVVLEFWGMLHLSSLKELCWPFGFTKEQVRPLIDEANDLGLEIIPMMNHWGHASAGRVMHGKHVVLDQNPSLQYYFNESGWCWDIRSPKVRALLKSIRKELVELCGNGEFFHIGCDEAYDFVPTKENMDMICDYLNEVCAEMRACGRRIIVWGDMFLFRHPHYNTQNRYACNAVSPEMEAYMLNRLDHDIVMADWQYNSPCAPVETAAVFTKAGFDCLLCPWDVGYPHMHATMETIKSGGLNGYMHTTWHTLTKGMPYVTLAAIGGFEETEKCQKESVRTCTAALLRKVMPIKGDYAKAGWSRKQIDCIW